jgi:Na+-translocating ferredoxin:NAD+ oxidoreductase RnfG subunit
MNKKELIVYTLFFFLMECILAAPSFAVRLMTEDQALKKMFPEADSIVTESRVLDSAEMDKLKARTKKLVLYQKGSKSEELAEKNDYTFYFAMKDGKRTGVAMIEMQPGKWGPVQFIVALDLAGKVNNVAVMFYVEQRGRPIARKSFMGQFAGKSSGDDIKVRKDIRAISGATISSRCSAFTVRKVIALYENLYLNGGKPSTDRKF